MRQVRESAAGTGWADAPAGHDIIVIGASAGGVEALRDLAAALPADLHAAICVTLHLSPNARSYLPEILSRAGPLPAHQSVDGEPLRMGTIVVAPPDRHLLIQAGRIRIRDGARENHVRPAIDPLFRSAAQVYGSRVSAVVLSGTLDDGSAGLAVVKRWGGTTLVQDLAEAQFPDMPRNAISSGAVDYVLPIAELSACLVQLSHEPPSAAAPFVPPIAHSAGPAIVPRRPERSLPPMEPPYAADSPDLNFAVQHSTPGLPSGLICPECGGSLWEVQENGVTQYRCHVGHILSMESMLVAQAEALETALWNAVRQLRERAALLRRIATRMAHYPGDMIPGRSEEEAEEYEQQAALIRRLLLRQSPEAPA